MHAYACYPNKRFPSPEGYILLATRSDSALPPARSNAPRQEVLACLRFVGIGIVGIVSTWRQNSYAASLASLSVH